MAYQEAVGINLGDRYLGNAAYVASASRFLYNIVDLALAEILSRWGAVVAPLFIVILIVTVAIPRRVTNRTGRLSIVCVAVLGGIVAIFLWLRPARGFNDALRPDMWILSNPEEANRLVICAHIPEGATGLTLSWCTPKLRGRIHGFNVSVAHVWAEQERLFDKAGQHMPVEDSYIAATARHHGLTIATGNDRDFRGPGLKVFNPFKRAH